MSRIVSVEQAKKDLMAAIIYDISVEKDRIRKISVRKRDKWYEIITCGVYKID